ncbi:MXAN_6640 family putative metalloprotease [Gemmatimonadota bacterium]
MSMPSNWHQGRITVTAIVIGAGIFIPLRGGGVEAQQVSRSEFDQLMQSEVEIFRNSLHPSERDLPIKCGLPLIMNTFARLGRSAAAAQVPRPFLENKQIHATPGGAFLIHYTINSPNNRWDEVPDEDLDGDTIPDYIEAAAASLDSVRAGYLSLGWRSPISDGDLYDIYFKDLEAWPLFGYTQPDHPASTSAPWTSASFIVLENDFPEVTFGHEPLTSMRVTIAHEYHHAIQFAYNLPSEESFDWLAEASATYHEEVFYDGINDYVNYLPSFLGFPDISLTAGRSASARNHMYGAVLWAIYLESVYGADANRALWTLMADQPATPIEAHRIFLEAEETSMLASWAEFTSWILHTGDRAVAGEYFPEGASYSQVRIDAGDFSDDEITLPALAAVYRQHSAGTGAGGVALRILPSGVAGMESTREWGAGIAGLQSGGLSGVRFTTSSPDDPGGGTSTELFDQQSYDTVIEWSFTGDNISRTTGLPLNRTAGSSTEESTRLALAAADQIILHQNYPNPFRTGTHDRMWFTFSIGSPGDVDLEVRTLSGRVIWSRTITGLAAGQHYTDELSIGWDGRDSAGHLMPSGIYLMTARAGDRTRALKFTLIR